MIVGELFPRERVYINVYTMFLRGLNGGIVFFETFIAEMGSDGIVKSAMSIFDFYSESVAKRRELSIF